MRKICRFRLWASYCVIHACYVVYDFLKLRETPDTTLCGLYCRKFRKSIIFVVEQSLSLCYSTHFRQLHQ